MQQAEVDKLISLLNKSIVIKKYPLANLEHRIKQVGDKWEDYYLVWPFKARDSFQPLSHAHTVMDAWRLAAKRIEKSEKQ